jgi:hypothetical protein
MFPSEAKSPHKLGLISKLLPIKARDKFSALKIILIDFQYVKNFMA